MSNKRYPHISYIGKFKDTNNKCVLCGGLPTAKVEIQVSWFRGEDEIEHVCRPCVNPQYTLGERLYSKWEADYRELKRRQGEGATGKKAEKEG